MALRVGTLYALITADDGPFRITMSRVQRTLNDAGNSMLRFGRNATMALTLPLVGAAGFMIKASSDLQENINKVDVAFKENSQSIKDWSNDSLKSFGIAKSTALDMAALYGDMATGMRLNTKEAADMSKSLVGLAGDMASFKNMRIDVVNTSLKSIFTGETESLKQLGIVMTEQNLQEFALSKGIKRKIQDMTQAEKVNLRYAYVMSVTTNSQGDFIRTGAGAANQMRIFQETIKEVSAKLGDVMLPTFTKIVTKLNELIGKFGNLSDSTKTTILTFAGMIAILGPLSLALGGIAKVVSTVIGVVVSLTSAIAGLTVTQAAWIVSVASAVSAGLMLGAAAVAIQQNWNKLGDWFSAWWDYTKAGFSSVANLISMAFSLAFYEVMKGLRDVAVAIKNVPGLKTLSKEIIAGTENAGKDVVKTATDFLDSTVVLNSAYEKMVKMRELASQGMLDTLTDIYEKLKAEVGDLFNFDEWFKTDDASKKSAAGIADLSKAIDDALNKIGSSAEEKAKKTKSALDIINDTMKELTNSMKSEANSFNNALGGMFDKIQKFAKISPMQLMARQQAKTMAMQEWSALMEQMRARLGSGSALFGALLKEGPSKLGELRGLAGMSTKDLSAFNSLYTGQSGVALNAAAQSTANNFKRDAIAGGINITITGNQITSDNIDQITNTMANRLKAVGVY